jgi:peptide/nickel transport system permease protein
LRWQRAGSEDNAALRAATVASATDVEPRADRNTAWRRLRRDPWFWIGGGIVALILLAALLAPLVAPYDPTFGFRVRDGGLMPNGDPVGPGSQFLLGTDRLGRDVLSRLIYGARTSLTVGLAANVVATLFGSAVGATAGFVGNPRARIGPISLRLPVETLLMRMTDVLLSLPALLIAIALAAVVGPSLGVVVFVIAAILWTTTARIVYGRVLDIKRRDFIEAAEALGAPPWRILLRHVLPHVTPLVVVYATLGIAATILFEATLSYLGVGVPPPTPSWGAMIAEHTSFYASEPRLVLLPGLAIVITILAFNLLGDALRDALDPQLAHADMRARTGRT